MIGDGEKTLDANQAKMYLLDEDFSSSVQGHYLPKPSSVCCRK